MRRKVSHRRGALANSLLIVFCVVMFAAAAGGGFALARHLGGQPFLPPERVTAEPTTPANAPPAGSLAVMSGDAATLAGAQGGGYQISVPRGWVRFVEERVGDRLPNSTIVYFVSPDGTQTVAIERLPRFYPDHTVKDYLEELAAAGPDVTFDLVEHLEIQGLAGAPPSPEPAQHIFYRTTASAKNLVPRDAAAQNLNRVTFANLLPYGGDLWVLSVTVPVEQEDSGRAELFDKIKLGFLVTG